MAKTKVSGTELEVKLKMLIENAERAGRPASEIRPLREMLRDGVDIELITSYIKKELRKGEK